MEKTDSEFISDDKIRISEQGIEWDFLWKRSAWSWNHVLKDRQRLEFKENPYPYQMVTKQKHSLLSSR
jgi:hypothetical protein